jgi:cytochrome c biogenesis protein CcmG/thiol:disulfide interchange protein DsbE
MKRALRGLIFSLLIAATPGQSAPTLEAPALQGPRFSLDRLRGRVVVVDFWASWCEPCRRSFPALDDLSRRYASRGVTVVGVSVDDEAANCQRFVRELRPSFAVVHDASHQIADRWGPSSMPTTYVIGRDGVIAAVLTGDEVQQLESHVRAALER